jgi:hypothetical protein
MAIPPPPIPGPYPISCVDDNATAVQVKAEVKKFEKALQAVKNWRM